jgi:hypothetical protein
VAGSVAAAVVGAVVWQVAHPPANPHGDLAALLVARPADSARATPAAVGDRVNITRILPLDGDMRALMLVAQVHNNVRHAAGAAWTRPDAASVTVTLLQFDAAEVADRRTAGHRHRRRDAGPRAVRPALSHPRPSHRADGRSVTDLPGTPGTTHRPS